MKHKNLYLFLIIFSSFLFIGCEKDERSNCIETLDLIVLENNIETMDIVAKGYTSSAHEQIGNKTLINTEGIDLFSSSGEKIKIKKIEPGMKFTVMFDGTINETSPSRLNNVAWIQLK